MSIVRVFKILNIFPFSEKHLIDCDTGNKGCDGGSYTTAWKYLTNGSAKQSLYPYAPAVISQQNNKIDIKLFKINDLRLEFISRNLQNQIHQTLANIQLPWTEPKSLLTVSFHQQTPLTCKKLCKYTVPFRFPSPSHLHFTPTSKLFNHLNHLYNITSLIQF